MKRDMDLVRLILLEAEGETEVDLSAYTEEQADYHRSLLYKAGYIDGIPILAGHKVLQISLTWDGHDFLDDARDDAVWNEAKKQLTARGLVSASVDVLKSVVTAVAIQIATKGLT